MQQGINGDSDTESGGDLKNKPLGSGSNYGCPKNSKEVVTLRELPTRLKPQTCSLHLRLTIAHLTLTVAPRERR